ncbi:7779_t:CDS:2 [Cetraspora pellucida]|uniref:7779_t:CDS:1 n=1 Tax=Cetraspora pellucida TaxID=1433469 RepID=A0A9N8WC16_9GLOM|nr:7779_t:CDS:2 [Cetraspora pellucida]
MGKNKCDFDRMKRLDPRFAKRYEKIRKKFENGSLLSNIICGPFFTGLYALGLYPRVFFNHWINNNPLHPSLTIYQETAIRTLKRAFDSPLTSIRKNVSLFELFIKTFKCTEPITSLIDDIDTDFNGYWLGSETWRGQPPEAILLYVHGGPYISATSLSGIQSLCFLLQTLRTKYNKHVRVLAIDYELAPEEPFPVGLNYLERAYRWLVSSDRPGSQKVLLCGDSIGAVMVLGLLHRIYTDNSKTVDSINPMGAILISPWVELSCDSFSYFTNARYDYLSNCLLRFASEYYVFGKRGDPSINFNRHSKNVNVTHDKDIFSWLNDVEDTFDLTDIKDGDESNLKSVDTETEITSREDTETTDTKTNEKVERSEDEKSSLILDSHNDQTLNHDDSADNDINDTKTDSGSRIDSILEAYNKIDSRSTSDISDNDPKLLFDSILNAYDKNPSMINTNRRNNHADARSRTESLLSSRPPSILRSNTLRSSNGGERRKSRNSVRFSDVIEIHTPSEFGQKPQITLESLSRNNSGNSRKSKKSLKRLKKKRNSINRAQSEDPFRNPFVSPLHTPHHILAKYPPLFISYGGKEVLRDDIEMFCQKCIKSKKYHSLGSESGENESNDWIFTEIEAKDGLHPDVIIETDEDMVHNYPILLGTFGEHSRNALTRMAAFINDLLPKNAPEVCLVPHYNQRITQNSLDTYQFTEYSSVIDNDSVYETSTISSIFITSSNSVLIPKSMNVPPLQPLVNLPNSNSPISLPKPLTSLHKSSKSISNDTFTTFHDKPLLLSSSKLLPKILGRESMSSFSTGTYISDASTKSSSNASALNLGSDVFANSRQLPIKRLSTKQPTKQLHPIIPIEEEE